MTPSDRDLLKRMISRLEFFDRAPDDADVWIGGWSVPEATNVTGAVKAGDIRRALSADKGVVEALVEALKPFAKIADEYSDQEDDEFQVWKDFDVLGATLPLRNFRRARQALAAASPAEGDGR